MKKKFLIPLLPLFLVSFLAGCNTKQKINDCDITIIDELTSKTSVIALPNQSVSIPLNNINKDDIAIKIDNSDICVVTVNNDNQLTITTLKEGTCNVTIQAGAYKSTIKVECLDLAITNKESHIDVGGSLDITLSKDVNAEISLNNNNVASLNGMKVNALKEGSFTVKVKYGDIVLTRDFDSYAYKNTITDLNRDNPFIHYLGRNYHANGVVKMDNEGSGFEVYFKGTSLKATLNGKFGSWYGNTMISVLVDDEIDTTKRVITLSKGAKNYEYTLVENLTDDYHRVKVLKRTENLSTYMTLTNLTTDGRFYPVNVKEKLKIEVYGDSISAGYGNLRGDLTDTTSAKYQSGLQTYAAYTAFALDAEINIQARSGIGMYTANNTIGEGNHVKDHFNKVNYDGENEWNFNNYIPDIVLINLGTNDYWDSANFNEDKYITYYVQTVKSLSEAYGKDTSFILLSGLMEQEVNTYVLKVKNKLESEISNKVYTYQFNKCEEGHPKYLEHVKASDQLIKLIKENNLDVNHSHSSEKVIPVSQGETVTASLRVRLQDELPDDVDLYINIDGYNDLPSYKLTKVDAFTYTGVMDNVDEGDYSVYFTLNDNKTYIEANEAHHTVHVRKDFTDEITLDTFLSMPEEIDEDSQFGWSMTDHLTEASFTATDSSNLSVNNTNWLAGFVIRNATYGDNYSISAHIKANAAISDYGQTYLGFVVYYASETDYVVVYLQYNSDGSLRGLGCTGMLDGADIGWNDFFSFSGTYDMVNEGVDFKVSRNGTTLKAELGSQTESQDLAKMSSDTEKVGIFASCATSISYTNFTESEHTKEVSTDWVYTSHLYDGTMTPNADGSITLYNSSNWMAGFAVKETTLTDNYTMSATITNTNDKYALSDDITLGFVPFYVNTNNFIVVYLQWDANSLIKSMGCTGLISGVDLSWNDIWSFAGITTTLSSGQEMVITRSNKTLTVQFAGITGSTTLSTLDGLANRYFGFYSNKTTTTFSNIQISAKN